MGKGKGGIEGFERVLSLLSIETNGVEPGVVVASRASAGFALKMRAASVAAAVFAAFDFNSAI